MLKKDLTFLNKFTVSFVHFCLLLKYCNKIKPSFILFKVNLYRFVFYCRITIYPTLLLSLKMFEEIVNSEDVR